MKKNYWMWVCVALFTGAWLVILGVMASHAEEPHVEPAIDISYIEMWCSGGANSTIRMMGGEKYDDKGIVTEDGNIWDWDGKVEDGDFLLVWIDDNGTPNNVKDDIVVKVWREVI